MEWVSYGKFRSAGRGTSPPAVDLEEIAMEWLKENTDLGYTMDDLRAIAKLIVRFVSEGVVG